MNDAKSVSLGQSQLQFDFSLIPVGFGLAILCAWGLIVRKGTSGPLAQAII
jgi:hypothetical protein